MLKGKVALITGAAKGIGYGIARKFAENGCDIVLNVHHDLASYERGMEKVASLEELGVKCLVIQADVSDAVAVGDMVRRATDVFGRIDILVNNAARAPHPVSIFDITDEDWDKVQSVNLRAAFLMCREVGRLMKAAGGGRIINISAVSGTMPLINDVHYNSSKAGLNMLTRDLALELAPFNVTVNCISPGMIVTELLETVVPPGVEKDAFFSQFARKHVPMGRAGTPEEIGNAALFFASELSAYVTGEVLLVAGGVPLTRTSTTDL